MAPRQRRGKSRGLPGCVYPGTRRGITYYRLKHPVNGTWHGLGRDRDFAIRVGRQVEASVTMGVDAVAATLQRILREGGDPFEKVAEAFKAHRAKKKLAAKTLREENLRVDSAIEAWRGRPIDGITRREIVKHLEAFPNRSADTRRTTLRQLFDYAVAEGYVEENPVTLTWARNAEVERQRLVMDEFDAIRKEAPQWMQNAMDLSLITLQARFEVALMRFDDEREPDRFFVDRQKVARHEAGHIRITIGPEFRALIRRCRDEIASPFLVHRKPLQRRPRKVPLEHWTQVPEDFITKEFRRIRDELGIRADLKQAWQRPSFHEIRSLGADRYREQGVDEALIQRLLGHTTERMTKKYLDRRGRETRYVDAETA